MLFLCRAKHELFNVFVKTRNASFKAWNYFCFMKEHFQDQLVGLKGKSM